MEDIGYLTHQDNLFLSSDCLIRVSVTKPIGMIEQTIIEEYGPFLLRREIEIPLWLAFLLYENDVVKIIPPTWLSPENLSRIRAAETDNPGELIPLPDYFFEICEELFDEAPRCVDRLLECQGILAEIISLRSDKITQLLKGLSEALTRGSSSSLYTLPEAITSWELSKLRTLQFFYQGVQKIQSDPEKTVTDTKDEENEYSEYGYDEESSDGGHDSFDD
ncbi:DNA replication complex GINS protein Psf2 like protein [Aduncisulcus paluster]|uniref:DNA replication complex GINS protein Psf2 like protein n=1 Tax=Aduncisulcus paluster TaxID=2918883 RepID=A0ABQ5K7W5_9EUKA|nr:DNA replication complex GINS protein Psf2 like protein [Aduncisulcus paluster]